MEISTELFEKYYYPIIQILGHMTFTGCPQLAYACAAYNPGMTYKELCGIVAEKFDTTPVAVKRNLTIYCQAVRKGISEEELSTVLKYNVTKITPFELIPILKFSINGVFDNA